MANEQFVLNAKLMESYLFFLSNMNLYINSVILSPVYYVGEEMGLIFFECLLGISYPFVRFHGDGKGESSPSPPHLIAEPNCALS